MLLGGQSKWQLWASVSPVERHQKKRKEEEMEEQEREYMIVMKVCGCLPPLSFIVYKSRGRTDTPVGVGTKEGQLERHLSSSIITLLCGLHTTFFSTFFCLSNIFLPSLFLSPLSLLLSSQHSRLTFLSVFEAISFPFVLPAPLCPHQPPTLFPTFPPPG